jgi:hypothetical protein
MGLTSKDVTNTAPNKVPPRLQISRSGAPDLEVPPYNLEVPPSDLVAPPDQREAPPDQREAPPD